MNVTDDKDKLNYQLSGNTAGIKPGDRVALQGKKILTKDAKTRFWQIKKAARDFGVCQP